MTQELRIDPLAAADRAGITVRAAEPTDLDAINRTLQDPGVIPGTLQIPFTSHAQRQDMTITSPHVRSLVAVDTDTNQIVGSLGLVRCTSPRRIHTATIGMSVLDAWQGRGVGTALLAAAVDVADRWWQVTRIHLEVFTDNAPAIALYRKFGFEIEGTLRADAFRDGTLVDTYVMARLTPELTRVGQPPR